MSPQAGIVLVKSIVPLIRSAVPRCARSVGAEDAEELIQDCIVMAAQILHRLEERGKEVTPGNVAYYAILHIKSGRRSQSCSRADVMAPGTQLDQKSCVLSFEEPVGFDMEIGEPVRLGEMMVSNSDDASVAAARNLDWETFLVTHDHQYRGIVRDTALGKPLQALAKRHRMSISSVSTLRRRLASELRESMGADILMDVCRKPGWQSNLKAETERVACRADRRRWVG